MHECINACMPCMNVCMTEWMHALIKLMHEMQCITACMNACMTDINE